MTAVSPVTKAARQARIAAILARAQVRSQEELAELLADGRGARHPGHAVARPGGARRGAAARRGGALVYALPGEPGGPGSRPGGVALAAPAGGGRPRAPGPAGPGRRRSC